MFTILVLEDDVELNETMTYGLEKEGYRVISVHSREEAEKAAENSPLALAILTSICLMETDFSSVDG